LGVSLNKIGRIFGLRFEGGRLKFFLPVDELCTMYVMLSCHFVLSANITQLRMTYTWINLYSISLPCHQSFRNSMWLDL